MIRNNRALTLSRSASQKMLARYAKEVSGQASNVKSMFTNKRLNQSQGRKRMQKTLEEEKFE